MSLESSIARSYLSPGSVILAMFWQIAWGIPGIVGTIYFYENYFRSLPFGGLFLIFGPALWIFLGVLIWRSLLRRTIKSEMPFMGYLLSLVGTWGVAISVFALIVIQSVMAGFSQDLRDKILRFSPPIVLKPLAEDFLSGKKPPPLPQDPRITEVTPSLETEVIIHTGEDQAQGAKLKGIPWDDTRFFNRLQPNFVEGLGVEDLKTQPDLFPGVLLGTELAKRLNILPLLTEEVKLIYPFGEVDPTGEMRPKTRHFRVIGTFKSGYFDYDNKFALVDLPEARRLVPLQEVPTEWGIWVKNFFEADSVAASLQQSLDKDFKVESWGGRNRRLFTTLRLERLAMFLVLTLMIAIASFNLFSLTMMLVVDKMKEIAIFRALGMERRRIEKVFSRVGLILGLIGTAVGFFLSMGTVLFLKWWPLHVPSPYYLDHLPVKIEPFSILLVVIVAPLLALLASWYPAKRGGRFEIAESLRYE